MSLDQFSPQQIKLNNSAHSFFGVLGQAADYGATVVGRQSDGQVQITSRSIPRLAPRASWSTYAPDLLIDAMDDSPLWPILALDASNGLVMVGAKAATSNAGYASGSVHEALTALRGCVYATGFTWDGPDSDLVGAFAALFISSTGEANAPALVPSQVALPAQPIPVPGFDLTSLTIAGGTAVDGVSGFAVAGDPRLTQRWNHGKPYPQQIHGAGLNNPLIVTGGFATEDMALARSIGAIGSVGTVVATFNRHGEASATRASGAGNVITITMANCLARLASAHEASQGSPARATIELLPRATDDQPMFTAVVS
jgi:hypothetical protein